MSNPRWIVMLSLLAAVLLAAAWAHHALREPLYPGDPERSRYVERMAGRFLAQFENALRMVSEGDYADLARHFKNYEPPPAPDDQWTPPRGEPPLPESILVPWRRGQAPKRMALPIDWHAAEYPDNTFRSYLHALEWLGRPMRQARRGDPQAAALVRTVLRDWIRHSMVWPPRQAPPFAWHDLSTARRLRILIRALREIRDDPLLDAQLRAAIVAHLGLLGSLKLYRMEGNHGMLVDRIIYDWVGRIRDLRGRGELRTLAASRLIPQLQFAFTGEGVHKENSPCYFLLGLNSIVDTLNTMRARDDIAADLEGLRGTADRAARFYTHVVREDGSLPSIGDCTGARKRFDRIAVGSPYVDQRPALAFALDRSQGAPPADTAAIFPRSGWAIFRDRWADDPREEVFAAIQSDHFSSTHYHEDDTSFVLSAYGDEYIVDPGYYSYNDDPLTRYARTAPAHNLLLVDGARFDARPENLGRSGITRHVRALEGTGFRGTAVELTHPHYEARGVRVFRQFAHVAPAAFLITDIAESDEPHDYTKLFHLAPGGAVEELEPGWLRITWAGRSHALHFRSSYAGYDVVEGEMEPVQGWVFPDFGRKVAAPVLRLHFPSRAALRVSTLVAIAPAESPPSWIQPHDSPGELIRRLEEQPRVWPRPTAE